MAQTASPSGAHHTRSGKGHSTWATGGAMFAGVLLFVDGVLAVLNGVVSIARDNVYTLNGSYTYQFTLTSWGWIHLVVGVLLVLTGLGIMSGASWARVLGVGMAAVSIVANFMWLPYQPVWAVIAIAIGVFVIWSLLTDRTRPVAR
ncbi:hypothetical protein [Streptomyces sp. NP-1717]|uniref:DUF7144 family membrane protein n=1 Tax=unclassified Streptomyces TaxID=2593676 RepID=UPI001F5CC13F|nr:hypothetical protein [Streptomyces sp. NP-1717]MCI3220667.1 hypothetical protein [Streptomyces sp. NP-1717]WTA77516.1 hypothetical protein OG705_33860 [Streptomyces sp. NBC_00838]